MTSIEQLRRLVQAVLSKMGLGTTHRQTIKIVEYEGSTALSVQNDRDPDLHHIFYVKKWGREGADDVIERLEGNEYRLVEVRGS